MHSIPVRSLALALTMAGAVSLLGGCHVNSHKDGSNQNVDIGTPFGSMQVKTNDEVNANSIGLTAYPGATPVKDKGNKDAADVNMSFGSFHMSVKVLAYQTPDPVDKVVSFYRKDMGHYGDIIECRGTNTVGTPDRTAEGLTCREGGNTHFTVAGDANASDDLTLRAGSMQRQHIVSVESKDGGTRIGLVQLSLPIQIHDHDDKQSQ